MSIYDLRILFFSTVVLGSYLDTVCSDRYQYDLFHVRERYIDLETGTSSTYNINYSKDATIVRGMGVVTACLGASLFTTHPLPLFRFLALGKTLTACVTAGIGCGMVYYRTRMKSSWTIHPQPDSYEASFRYGIKHYFLKPFIITIPIVCIIGFTFTKIYPK